MPALRAYQTKGYVCTFRKTIIERLTNNLIKGEETFKQSDSIFCTASTIHEQIVVLYTYVNYLLSGTLNDGYVYSSFEHCSSHM